MKGLLYKEWCLGKKTCGLFLVLSLVFCLLGILVFLSMICGNLKSWPSEAPTSVKVFSNIFYYVPYILMLFAATGVNQSIFADYDSGWMKYSYTLPQKAINVVGAKYIYVGIIYVVSFVFGLLNAGVICLMSKQTLSVDILKNMVFIFLFAVCEMAVVTPMALKFKKSSTLCTIGAVFVMAVYGISGYAMIEIGNKYPENAEKVLEDFFVRARDMIMNFSIIIILVMITLSLFISCKIYQGREK